MMKSILFRLITTAFLLVLLIPNISKSAQERRIALVIGNGAYNSSPLANPVNDANDMAAALKKLGFSVRLRINANQRSMENAIRSFGKELSSGDVGLFYYAGHGLQVNGRNYLIPIDADIESEADVKYESVDAGRVLSQMHEADNGLNIIILDACRDNPFARSFRSSEKGLAKMDAPTGSILAYATAPGSVAADGNGRNGLYTSMLLKHMAEPNLTIERIFKRARIDVVNASGNRQIPWESSSLMGDFYFNTKRGIAVVKPPVNTDLDAERKRLEQERKELERIKADIEKRKRLETERKQMEAEKKKQLKKENSKYASISPEISKPIINRKDRSLAAYYPFNGNANDESGNGKHGVEYGGVRYIKGKYGKAAYFDGKNDYVKTAYIPKFNTEDSFTISLWVKGEKQQSKFSIILGFKKAHKSGIAILYGDRDTYKYFNIFDENAKKSNCYYNNKILDGHWHHVVAVRDTKSKFVKLYIDGNIETQTPDSTSQVNTAGSRWLAIGAWNHELHGLIKFFKGAIDEIKIFHSALSKAQIKKLYNLP